MRELLNRKQLYNAVYEIMEHKLNLPMIADFKESARLNEDLYMDSVMILQLILHLELDLGVHIPDEMLVPKDFHTVSSLLDFLEGLSPSSPLKKEKGI